MACRFSSTLFMAALVFLCCGDLAASERFLVGDEQGWREPDFNHTDVYSLWAGSIRFRVGDSIYFEYTNDSVLVVDKRGYYHCDAANATQSFNDGKTTFVLDKPGLFYFISGAPGHCKSGQRLVVDVMTRHAPEQPPSLVPLPPPVPAPEAPVPSPLASGEGAPAVSSLVVVVVLLVVAAVGMPVSLSLGY